MVPLPGKGYGGSMGHVTSVRRGHSPNCSATGLVVGTALLTVAAAGVLVNTFADRLAAYPADPPPEPPRVRREGGGGAVLSWALPPALLFVGGASADRALAAGATAWGPPVPSAVSAPLEAHVSLGQRCPARCAGCHVAAGPDGDPGPADVPEVLAQLAAAGVFEVAFGGGEVLARPDLEALGRRARALGLVPNLTTSGLGLTAARARDLAAVFGQINVSIDGLAETHRAARGYEAAAAWRAVDRLREAGARVGVNTVLRRAVLPELDALGAALADRGVAEWQWLRWKPSGRARAGWEAERPDADALAGLWPAALRIEAATGLTLRWDCAMVPFLAMHDVPPAALAAAGVEGCPGGRSLVTRDAAGRWAPCSFVSGGRAGELAAAWAADPQLRAWRARPPPPPCDTCPWLGVCGGGCRAVAAHVAGDPFAPDPECPRVRAGAP